MIKEVKILNNVVMVNLHHEIGYDNEEGVMIIEKEDGEKYIIDLESSTDISSSDYIDIVPTKKTKEKILFKNILFDTELLKRLAGN